jgi:hypothetical protein
MTLNPSHDLKVLLPQLLDTLKQAADDPDSVDIDMGQAQQTRDALNNIINAKQQEGGGKSGKSGGGKSSKDDKDDKGDDDKDKGEDESEKKNRSGDL